MAPAVDDPYYSRKPVPKEFIEHVGFTGMTPEEEYLNSERKYSVGGSDVRNFSNPKGDNGKHDPYYQRKQVPDSMIHGVGDSGLSPEEEYQSREKKAIVNGVDVRRFSTSSKGGMTPQSDPYYARKQVHKVEIADVGQSGMSRAEEYETRERKQSIFQDSTDPFQQLTGSGHRQSVSGTAGPAAADARRRSSAVAPDATAAAARHHGQHSGYGGEKLTTIESRADYGETSGLSGSSTTAGSNYGITHTGATHTGTSHSEISPGVPAYTAPTATGGHSLYHDLATDPDSVAPDEIR